MCRRVRWAWNIAAYLGCLNRRRRTHSYRDFYEKMFKHQISATNDLRLLTNSFLFHLWLPRRATFISHGNWKLYQHEQTRIYECFKLVFSSSLYFAAKLICDGMKMMTTVRSWEEIKKRHYLKLFYERLLSYVPSISHQNVSIIIRLRRVIWKWLGEIKRLSTHHISLARRRDDTVGSVFSVYIS